MDRKTDRGRKIIRVLLLLATVFLASWSVCSAQEPEKSVPRVDILTLNGGKPNLSAAGEGITAYKTTYLYKLGTTRVRLMKPADLKFKIELPAGYTVFNDLIYQIETDTIFSGPQDIVFHLPSARTKETFANLRILYPEYDVADPEVPGWRDGTLDHNFDSERYLSESAYKERVRDFKSRTLHAFIESSELFFVVALRDPAKARDGFAADLELKGTVNAQVTEGRPVTYELKVTNRGPETATGIALHAQSGFEFVSVEASQGKCKMDAQNVYCKLASLEKDRSLDVKIVDRCPWDRHYLTGPPGYQPEPINAQVSKSIRVSAYEADADYENNHVFLTTEVLKDDNKGPVIEVTSPASQFQNFDGPAASVPVRFKASDPDGFIKQVKVELFDLTSGGKSLGEPVLVSEGEYELIIKDVTFGRKWVRIVATDNMDRFTEVMAPEFFVNGPAKVEIISPKSGSTVNRGDGELTVTIRATSPSTPLKKVSLTNWELEATAVGNDNYVVKLKNCQRTCRLQAIAIDEKDVETRSEEVQFILSSRPVTDLRWYDGESLRAFKAGEPLKANELILVGLSQHENQAFETEFKKIEIFVDGTLVCTNREPGPMGFSTDCLWRPAPGRYRLQAVATDADGEIGKTEVIEVVIERP